PTWRGRTGPCAARRRCRHGARSKGWCDPGRCSAVCATFTSGWLDHRLSFAPSQVLLGGQNGDRRVPGQETLVETICHVYELEGRLPLPHASGASRWLNDPTNAARHDQALSELSRLRVELGL